MGEAPSTVMVERTGPNLWERALTLASWALAGALFLTVGWFAMEPDDPLGPVSAYARQDGLLMLMQAAALGGVAAAIATVLAGRRLADIGTFAAAFGLGAASLRGSTAEFLLIRGADLSATFERGLAFRFAAEGLAWFVVVMVAMGVSAVVMRWCHGLPGVIGSGGADHRDVCEAALHAGFDVPGLPDWWLEDGRIRQTSLLVGIQHTLVASAVALAAFAVLSAGLRSRSIQHGQVCFVVAAAVGIGTYAACRVSPVRSALWAILAVGVVAFVGYVWAMARPPVSGLPPNIPSSHFLRILPVQFVAVGTAAAVATFWSLQASSGGVHVRDSRRARAVGGEGGG